MLDSILIFAALVWLFCLIFAADKRRTVIGEPINRKSDAVIEVVAHKCIFKEKQ